ncbi:Rab GDP dissociation inhibitor alpha [Conglomerata obtusa]
MHNSFFDYTILGTGLQQCITSHTLSQTGSTVLQLDQNHTYGSELRTLRYTELCTHFNVIPNPGLIAHDREFNIDLTPKFILADGLVKELLVEHSLEELIGFVNVEGSFVAQGGVVRSVPCDEKSSVSSGLIGIMQKPRVARFFWNVRKYCELREEFDKEYENIVKNNVEFEARNTTYDIKTDSYIKKDVDNSFDNEKNVISCDKEIDLNNKKNQTDTNSNKVDAINKKLLNSSNSSVQALCHNIEINKNLKQQYIIQKIKTKMNFKNTMLEEFKHFSINTNSIEIIGHAIALNLNNIYLEKHPIETYDKIYYYIRSLLSLETKLSPFIYPLYGLSEICQAFSRRAGQYGCVFMLNTKILEIKEHKGKILEPFNNVSEYKNDVTNNKTYSTITDSSNISNNNNDILDDTYSNDKINTNAGDDSKLETDDEITCAFDNLNIEEENNTNKIKNAKFCLTIKESNNVRKIYTNKIIAEPNYFKNNTKLQNEIITCICIIKGEVEIFKNKYKISSGHVIFLATDLKRSNDIFMAVLGERENVSPNGYKIAIVSTIKETKNHETEIEPVIKTLGNIVEKFIYLREILVKNFDNDDIVLSNNVDQTTHFESLYEDILRVTQESKNNRN